MIKRINNNTMRCSDKKTFIKTLKSTFFCSRKSLMLFVGICCFMFWGNCSNVFLNETIRYFTIILFDDVSNWIITRNIYIVS